MKSNILVIVLGVLLVLPSFAQISDASQVPKVDTRAKVKMLTPPTMRQAIQPKPAAIGDAVVSKTEPVIKGVMSVDAEILTLADLSFINANQGDYDGDGIPNTIDIVCQDSPKDIVMLMKADMPTFGDYIYTLSEDMTVSSDVTIGNFLFRYIRHYTDSVALRSYYNPNQVDSGMSGNNCVWPPSGESHRDVYVKPEWKKMNTLCGSRLARLIYHNPTSDNVVLQFINLTQIPEVCMHPDPGPYEGDVNAFQAEISSRMALPECQGLKYPRDRFSHIAYQEARAKGYPVGCRIEYPITQYTGPTVSPCNPYKTCLETNMDCASAGLVGDCGSITSCCTPAIVK